MPERPWCCPDPSCVPIHQLANRDDLATAKVGDSFSCFGRMSRRVEFVYDGEHHPNSLSSCHYTPLKGILRWQEHVGDWAMLSEAYATAVEKLEAGAATREPEGSPGEAV